MSTTVMAFCNRYIILFGIILATFGFGYEVLAARAHFLIVYDPSKYSILDKYEQTVAPYAVLAGSPFRLIDTSAVLGDRITSAIKTRLGNDLYFFLKTTRGYTIGGPKDVYGKIYYDCELFNDTLVILKDGVLELSEKYPSAGRIIKLKQNDVLIGIFHFKGRSYLQKEGPNTIFGWCDLSRTDGWRVHKSKTLARKDKIDFMLQKLIEKRLEKVNQTYLSLFEYFNARTSQQKPVPQWKIENTDSSITCRLLAPQDIKKELEGSTSLLVDELKNMLIGRTVVLRYNNGEITIIAK